MQQTPDQSLIRRIVDRVIETLGPGASTDEVRRTAVGVLERLEQDRDFEMVVLADIPGGDKVFRTRLTDVPGLTWARSAIDLPARDPGTRLAGVAAELGDLVDSNGRILLTVGTTARTSDLDWIPALVERDRRLRIAVVCARPGLGVDLALLDRFLSIRKEMPSEFADRVYAASMRLPVARTGMPRIEVLLRTGSVEHSGSDGELRAASLVEDLRSHFDPQGITVSSMLLLPTRTSDREWIAMRSWRVRFGSLRVPIQGLRVGGWPANVVRPFGDTPLCTTPDRIVPTLLSLACGCAQAPVCLAPSGVSTNGTLR